jgi:hypothetical protein
MYDVLSLESLEIEIEDIVESFHEAKLEDNGPYSPAMASILQPREVLKQARDKLQVVLAEAPRFALSGPDGQLPGKKALTVEAVARPMVNLMANQLEVDTSKAEKTSNLEDRPDLIEVVNTYKAEMKEEVMATQLFLDMKNGQTKFLHDMNEVLDSTEKVVAEVQETQKNLEKINEASWERSEQILEAQAKLEKMMEKAIASTREAENKMEDIMAAWELMVAKVRATQSDLEDTQNRLIYAVWEVESLESTIAELKAAQPFLAYIRAAQENPETISVRHVANQHKKVGTGGKAAARKTMPRTTGEARSKTEEATEWLTTPRKYTPAKTVFDRLSSPKRADIRMVFPTISEIKKAIDVKATIANTNTEKFVPESSRHW